MTKDDIKARLEDAGKTIMMLPVPKHGFPQGERAAWPSIVRTPEEFFAAQILADADHRLELLAGRNAVRVVPQQKQISELEEVLGWLYFIKDPPKRRVVTLRSLRHPYSDRYLFGWRRLAREFGVHENTVRNWFSDGLAQISQSLAQEGNDEVGRRSVLG